MEIADILDILGVPRSVLGIVKCEKGNNKTPVQVSLRRAVSLAQLLSQLGLAGFRNGTNYPDSHITTGGLFLKSENIIAEFGWTTATYRKKIVAYDWAHNAAKATWKGAIHDMTNNIFIT